MPAVVSPVDRYADIETARFGAMVGSESFQLLKARIVAELERARTDCETQTDVEIHRAQGKAKALRTVLELPAIMLTEMKQRKKK